METHVRACGVHTNCSEVTHVECAHLYKGQAVSGCEATHAQPMGLAQPCHLWVQKFLGIAW